MDDQKVVVLMGSSSDVPFAHRIGDFFEKERISVKYEYRVSSAHKTPEKLLSELKAYEEAGDHIIYITVAGLSDALSGVVAGFSSYPVIACSPDAEKHGWAKIFSSTMTPKGVTVSYVAKPENAALMAAKIFALSNPSLHIEIEEFMRKTRETVEKADHVVKQKTGSQLHK
ncbi:MAG: AIR carboxylase family protein [Candidatus Bathyarchaeota archaeon]|jgi:phosphoribosylaminoimidazole carboxylase PurE protein|nr:AIR carboxylase family protein [Candidatus Bathyarchaeota archaeon]